MITGKWGNELECKSEEFVHSIERISMRNHEEMSQGESPPPKMELELTLRGSNCALRRGDIDAVAKLFPEGYCRYPNAPNCPQRKSGRK